MNPLELAATWLPIILDDVHGTATYPVTIEMCEWWTTNTRKQTRIAREVYATIHHLYPDSRYCVSHVKWQLSEAVKAKTTARNRVSANQHNPGRIDPVQQDRPAAASVPPTAPAILTTRHCEDIGRTLRARPSRIAFIKVQGMFLEFSDQ